MPPAILRDPDILVLDEPTSAIDSQSETLIYETLKEFTKGRTTFVITHAINRSIIQQACAQQNITIGDKEVASEIRRIARKFGMEPANWYQMLQVERNITPAQYTRDIIWPMLALKKIAGAKVTITEKELRELYTREYSPRVEARMILLDNSRRAGEVHKELMRNPTLEQFDANHKDGVRLPKSTVNSRQVRKRVRAMRDAIEHTDKRLVTGKIGLGEPIMLKPKSDRIELSDVTILYAELSEWLVELNELAGIVATWNQKQTPGE